MNGPRVLLMPLGMGGESAVAASGTMSSGQVLAEKIAQYGADLAVMGAYNRKRLGEQAFGSVTNQMFAHAAAPLFLSR